jgi:hypothetical protein
MHVENDSVLFDLSRAAATNSAMTHFMRSGTLIGGSALLLIVCGCGSVVDDERAVRATGGAPAAGDASASLGESGAAGAAASAIPDDDAAAAGMPPSEGGTSGEGYTNTGGENSNTGGGHTNAAAGRLESAAVAARAESGTKLCQDPRDCVGLTCTSSEQSFVYACLAPCASDADCKLEERCFERAGLQKSCFQSCQESAVVCNYQFDCADYYRTGQYLCLPTAWVRSWPPTDP